MGNENKLDKICPAKDRYAIRGLFDESYDLTNELYKSAKWLSGTIIGRKDIRADILRGAIAHFAKLFCEKGILPYEFFESPNTIANCNHIELHGAKAIILPYRVEAEESLPKFSIFRSNYIKYYNIDSLFSEYQNETVIKYIAATYGDNNSNEFQFGRIGIPGNKRWVDYLPLVRGPYKAFTTKPEKESLLVAIREQIKEEGKLDE